MPDVYFVSGVTPFEAPKREAKISIRKINTKQLTQVKPIFRHGRKRFYFRYYCPDLQKDHVRKFANLEAEAKVLPEQIKEKQVLDPSSLVNGLTFGKLKHIF